MRNLIDQSFFIRNLKIQGNTENVSGTVLSEAANRSVAEIDQYIALYQKKYLEDMFGETLAANLPPELIALIVDDETKESPIANYVYYFYTRDKQTITPAAKGLNANNYYRTQITSVRDNAVFSWNEMVALNEKVHKKLYEDETITIFAETDDEDVLSYLDDILPEVNITSRIFEMINSLDL
jgi:hypothetical protein